MAIDPATPIREIALAVPGAMALFDKYGLDFCCSGNTSLELACRSAGLGVEDVIATLEEASHAAANVAKFHDWGHERPATVAEHIVDHNYAVERDAMANTSALIAKVACVHGGNHPELREVETVWAKLCEELTRHLHDEMPLLEPIAHPESGKTKQARASDSTFPRQRGEVVALARRIRVLTNDYALPADACDALESLYRDLAAFEADLHEHVLLDDVVLADKARRA